MRTNLPITQRDYDYADDAIIVSTTDAQGRITHCNRSFVEISGFDYEELLGQPHNLVRHPDMPPEAFKDMWATVGRGRPWTGIVKNRRKNGDHYWVKANVTPIMEGGRPAAYMSVRFKPTAAEVQEAQALYARIAAERESGRQTVRLHAGRVRLTGWRDLPGRLHRLSLSQRMAVGLAAVLASTMAVVRLWPGAGGFVHAAVASAAAGAVLMWFRHSVQSRLDEAERFATELASCNLSTRLDAPHPHPLSQLARALTQIQINLRAVVGDAREEVTGTLAALTQIAAGSRDLATRTDAQAAALQQTAASMEQFAQTVRHTAEHAAHVARESHQTAATAADGGRAIDEVTHTVHSIQASSKQMADIVQVIESIAFQTNVLAINAAVEAARAGDEGRGFAVVASEVRALAQRSARSAKEIRQLIHDSVRQVADGTQRMDAAGITIGRTVEAVQRVGQMIEQITQATSEQSGGIAQVNSAVGELDRVTQANALLVQQTADITHALSKRAEALKRSVQVYRE